MMEFRTNTPIEEWEKFLESLPQGSFLQSQRMKHVYAALQEDTIPISMYHQNTLVGVAFIEVVRARRGHFFSLAYGPVCTEEGWNMFPQFSAYLQTLGIEKGVDFVRCSPMIVNTKKTKIKFHALGWKKSPLHLVAEHLWLLDLRPSEENLIRGMRKTMRHSIRRAEKEGVVVRISTSLNDVNIFIQLHQTTVARHGFVPYRNDYFRAEVEAFLPHHAALCIAEKNGQACAAAIIIFYAGVASYHHGASQSGTGIASASALLQWRAIQEAKRRGCHTYNFWGIVPPEKFQSPILHRRHPFVGVSIFKTGFGGSRMDCLPCHDLPLNAKYYITQLIEILRRWKRGFW